MEARGEGLSMRELDGKTSARIRSGEINPDALAKGRDLRDEPPSPAAVRHAECHGMGRGATSVRNGGS